MADLALDGLIDRVRSARAPLCIRGGGTKEFYGNAPSGDLLDTRGVAGISSYEPTELVVTARCGTPLAELEAALAEHGQCLPFEPPQFGDAATRPDRRGATVGGMVAAGLAGPARAAVGSVRDYVLGATLLDGRGEVLSFGGQVMKNVAGYDVSRLLAGSLGVLGVILEVSLKVLPRPVATATLRFECGEAAALERLHGWGGQPLPLDASAWRGGVLTVRLRGAGAAVDAAAKRLGGEVVGDAERFWAGLRHHDDGFFAAARGRPLWRLAVPQTAPPLALAADDTLLEWGGGQRWLVSREPAATVRAAAGAVGGHATRFRRDADADADGIAFTPLSAPLARIHQALKRSFDPRGLFNPGRLDPSF